MTRILLGCAAVVCFALPCRADQASATLETLIRLRVRPARAPEPALRYLLLPEFREMNAGNAVQNYLKCFMGQERFFFDKDSFQRREALLAMPLKDLPAREFEDYGGFALSQADWAARLDTTDWQVLLKLKSDGPGVLLPDLQQFPPLAKALKVRFRAEVALGHFEAAFRTAKTMFAMVRHLGEHPTLVGNLEGLSVASAAIGPLEEMLEQPGCPNLYWALTNLPIPLVSLEKGIAGERDIFLGVFRDLDETAPMSTGQLERFVATLDHLLGGGKPVKRGEGVRPWLGARNTDQRKVDVARRRLVEFGLPEPRLREFPADQLLLLDEKREYEIRRDEILKLMNLPMWQAVPTAAQTRAGKEPALFEEPLLGGLQSVHAGQARLDQRIALLRHIEALRLYAAEHNGALPAKLSEVSVPLPNDPFTGKPFRYEVDRGKAHLRGTPPVGEEKDPRFNVHYELILLK